MSRDVVHIRSTNRTASQTAGSSAYTGFALSAGPIGAQLKAAVDPNGFSPGTLTLTSGTLFNSAFITVSWVKRDPTVVSFEIHLDRSGGGGLVQTQRTEGESAYFEPVISGETYDVTVWNIYLDGQRGVNSAVGSVVAALDTSVPAQPSGVTMGAGLRTVTASWADNTEIDVVFGSGSYHVQLATDSGFTTIVHDKKISGTITSIADLLPNTAYWFRVSAIDTSGNESPWTVGVSATTVQATGNDVLDAAIDTQHIANAAIGTLQVADAAITNAKVIDLDVSKLRAGTINGREIIVGGTAAVPATANWNMASGTNGSITSLIVNATELLGVTVPFNVSLSQTEQDISAQINLGTGTHGFTSIWSGGFVIITAPQPSQDWNGYLIVTLSTGDLSITNGTFANGQNLGILRSANYVAGNFGWYIDGTGNAELNNVTIRGTVYASSGSFSGTVYATAGSFSGSLSGSTINGVTGTFSGTVSGGSIDIGSGVFAVDTVGVLTATNATVTGTINAIAGQFSGNITAIGTITGGTIVGANVKTSTGGNRIEMTGDRINFYSGGALSGYLDGISTLSGSPVLQASGAKNIGIKVGSGTVFVESSSSGGIRLKSSTGSVETYIGTNLVFGASTAGATVRVTGSTAAINLGATSFGLVGTYTSRRVIKQNIRDTKMSDSIKRTMALRPRDFEFKQEAIGDGKNELVVFDTHRGFVAEEVAEVDKVLSIYGWVNPDNEMELAPIPDPPEGQDLEEWIRENRKIEDAVPAMWDHYAVTSDLVNAVKFLLDLVPKGKIPK